MSDSNYTVASIDGIIGFTSLTTPRIITLPSTSSVPAGHEIIIKDESGSCSNSNTLTIVGTIDGIANLVLNTAYASVIIYNNGTNWSRA